MTVLESSLLSTLAIDITSHSSSRRRSYADVAMLVGVSILWGGGFISVTSISFVFGRFEPNLLVTLTAMVQRVNMIDPMPYILSRRDVIHHVVGRICITMVAMVEVAIAAMTWDECYIFGLIRVRPMITRGGVVVQLEGSGRGNLNGVAEVFLLPSMPDNIAAA